ncbi:hypothetical protein [Diaphorobacter nitroreducens]
MNLKLLRDYGVQVFIAVDQLANALIPPIDGTLSYADETLSARAYRAHRDGKILGKLLMPVIDLLFFWQGKGHCYNAYLKEHRRANLPSEYRPAQAGFFTPGERK